MQRRSRLIHSSKRRASNSSRFSSFENPLLERGEKNTDTQKRSSAKLPGGCFIYTTPMIDIPLEFLLHVKLWLVRDKRRKKKRRIIAIADVRPMMCARIYRVHFVVFPFSPLSIIGEAGRLFKESNKGKVDSISDRVRQWRGEKLMEVIHERIRQVKFSRARRAKRLGWGRREVKFPVGSNQCV